MNYEEFQRLLHENDLDDADSRYSTNYNSDWQNSLKESAADDINSFLDDVQKRYQLLIEDLDTINKPPDVSENYDDIIFNEPNISTKNNNNKNKSKEDNFSTINHKNPNIDSEMMKIIEELVSSPNETSYIQSKSKESRIPKPKLKSKNKKTIEISETKFIPTENLINHKINEEILQIEANSGNYIAGRELAKVRINDYNKSKNYNNENDYKIRNEKIEKNLKELNEKAKIFSRIPIEKKEIKEISKSDENKSKIESKILKEMPEETVTVKKAVKKAKVRINENKSKFKKLPTVGEKRLKQLMKERDIRINNFYKKYFCN